jgi:2-hydroxychromene-2-carboxylate isomerase
MDALESGRTLPAKTVDFWFDYTCPFAYLGSTQAAALAERMGAALAWRPMLLGGVFRAHGTPQNLSNTLIPAKAAHNLADMQRWARRFGVPLQMPAAHPMRSVEALRATLATGIDLRVIAGFFRAYWVLGKEISTPEVITDVLTSAGHDATQVLRAIGTPEIKDDLRQRTDRAIELGIFGAPSWVVDGAHLYWGQDRLPFVAGERPRPPAVSSPSAGRAVESGRIVEMFWDFSSPFAYLAMTQFEAFARRTGARVVSRPMLLGGLFRQIGTPDVPLATFPETRQRYIAKDLERWASYWQVPFRFPSRFPTASIRALRIYLALPEERRQAYRDAVFAALWARDEDVTDDAVLAACVGDDALAREAFAAAGSDAVKGELRAATEETARRGVFGAPTFIVDGQDLYWGQDRMELVEEALRA